MPNDQNEDAAKMSKADADEQAMRDRISALEAELAAKHPHGTITLNANNEIVES